MKTLQQWRIIFRVMKDPSGRSHEVRFLLNIVPAFIRYAACFHPTPHPIANLSSLSYPYNFYMTHRQSSEARPTNPSSSLAPPVLRPSSTKTANFAAGGNQSLLPSSLPLYSHIHWVAVVFSTERSMYMPFSYTHFFDSIFLLELRDACGAGV